MNIHRILQFTGVSGAGLALDYAVYAGLYNVGLDAGWANLISASLAVTFVFVVSARKIFEHKQGGLNRLFVFYALYQAMAVSLASLAVDAATDLLDGRYILGKTVVVPLSLGANYLFMSWLLTRDRQPA